MFESVIIKNQWTIACSSKGNTNTDLKGIVPPSKLLDTDDIVRKAIWKCCLISSEIWTFITANITELSLIVINIFRLIASAEFHSRTCHPGGSTLRMITLIKLFRHYITNPEDFGEFILTLNMRQMT